MATQYAVKSTAAVHRLGIDQESFDSVRTAMLALFGGLLLTTSLVLAAFVSSTGSEGPGSDGRPTGLAVGSALEHPQPVPAPPPELDRSVSLASH